MELAVLHFVAAAASINLAPSDAPDEFSRFPAQVITAHAQPVIRLAEHRLFRTRIRQGMVSGINFAGHFTFVIVGCGAGCVNGWFVDRQNGRIVDAPVGGEEFPVLRYGIKPDSRLVKAEWLPRDFPDPGEQCVRQDFVWDRNEFKALNSPHKAACEDEDHLPG
ncbi:hypothetical protein [Sphingomonas sp.]|uniref:hypothetical protein n=1 Tax=Sphingomonas sp. TaxID=28214 RepID=UPI0025F06BA4|nr:hypothetical protein [Sphingomonas sp.]